MRLIQTSRCWDLKSSLCEVGLHRSRHIYNLHCVPIKKAHVLFAYNFDKYSQWASSRRHSNAGRKSRCDDVDTVGGRDVRPTSSWPTRDRRQTSEQSRPVVPEIWWEPPRPLTSLSRDCCCQRRLCSSFKYTQNFIIYQCTVDQCTWPERV